MSDEETKPHTVMIRAIDIIPYQYGIWCSVGGSKPFVNDIVKQRWSEDHKRIWFMLESFNFQDADPEEFIEVVPSGCDWHTDKDRAEQERKHDEFRSTTCGRCRKFMDIRRRTQ